MIFYFTGTGNSRYAAETLADLLEEEVVCLNEHMGKNNEQWLSQTPYLFVFPIYAWRMPRVVEKYIRANEFKGNASAYFIGTCGDSMGNAGHWCEKLCREKELNFKGAAKVVMPENYIAMFDVPSVQREKQLMDAADARLQILAKQIRDEKNFPSCRPSMLGRMESRFVNPLFYRFWISDAKFYAGAECNGCGACVKSCPLNNISLDGESRPVWGGNCTHCMACISICPKKTIEYGKISRDKRRYRCKPYAKKRICANHLIESEKP